MELVEYTSIPDKTAALRAGRIDLDLEVSFMAPSDFSAVEKIGTSSYYLVTNRMRPDLLEDINSALNKLLNNDLFYFARLQDRYFSGTVLSRNLTKEEKRWIAEHKVLRIGFFDRYLPFCAKDKNGAPIGAGIDAIREIIRKLKLEEQVKVEYVCYDRQEDGYRAVEVGEVDLMLPAYISNSVKRDYRIIGGKILATAASDLVYLRDCGDGNGKRIGVNRHNLMQYYYSRDAFPHAKIVAYENIRACLDGLLAGSADGTFLNSLRTEALLKPLKYRSLHALRAQNGFEFRMAFAQNSIGLMMLMDRGLTMLDPGFFNKASYSYAGRINSFSLLDYLREHIVTTLLSVAVLAALIAALFNYRINNRKLTGINRELTEYSETIEKQRQQETELRRQLEKKQTELRNALRMAQASNRAKTTFLSNMSHDIRTPMNAIIGFTGLATSHINDTERVLDYLNTIARSSEHLLALINDVLEMSRIESGKITLNDNAESLPEILDGLRDIVSADLLAKRHRFVIETAELRNGTVRCDRMRLNQVLLNLVSNAIKYTPPGGTISLLVTQKVSPKAGCGRFEFRCRDNGIGIGEEFLGTIFAPFTREENSTVSGIQGTGLGMAITKNLVELMGGTISVTSKKGEGSEFVVSLDLRIDDTASAAPAAPGGRRKNGAAPPEEEAHGRSLKGKKVLMVDDSKVNLKVGSLLLKERGMSVDTASDGQSAIGMIREKGIDAYDFILMDIQMPGMNGYETTAELRRLPGGDRLKIIAFSANAFQEDKAMSRKAGMNGHIAKPLKINELMQELERFSA